MIKSLKTRRIISNTIIYVILIAMSIVWLLPIFWLVLQSFGDGGVGLKQQLIPNLVSSLWVVFSLKESTS